MVSHQEKINAAFSAVAAIYAEKAAHEVDRIRQVLAAADRDWAEDGTLSQKALRAVRSTSGVTCTLIGTRREEYVSDVLGELERPYTQSDRLDSWQAMSAGVENLT
jgi:aryl-alcohol dehydrogenase-like predicted oxidoreductase